MFGEFIFVGIIVLLAFANAIGKAMASGLKEDQRMIVGGIALLISVLMTIYGIYSINSVDSQVMSKIGRPDSGGLTTIGLALLVAVTGITIIASKGKN